MRLAVNERQEMTGVITEVQPASGAKGDFIMCEVEAQQAARVEVLGPTSRAVIRVESEETEEEAVEIGFVPSALS